MRLAWRGKMRYDPSVGIWVRGVADDMAAQVKKSVFRRGLLQRRTSKRTIYNAHGRPVAEVKVHGSGNSEHEYDEHQDAVVRPDPIKVQWSMAREHMPTLAAADLPTLDQAMRDYGLARQRVTENPKDPEIQAQWRTAKSNMVAAKAQHRILQGRP